MVVARPDDWKREPFGDVQPIPYEAVFTEAEYARLKEGLVPRAMEHKWFIYFVEPSLFFHRSWTGRATFRVDIETTEGGARVAHAVCTADILEDHGGAYLAALVHFLVSNLLLGRSEPFPFPERFSDPAPGLFQHAVAGTGYPQVPFSDDLNP